MHMKELQKYGPSVWLDYMRRDLLASGEFARLVRDDGGRGATTNPAIFERPIAGTTRYDAALDRHVRLKDAPATTLYEQVTIEEIQQAADVLRPVYDATDRRDGYVSMEVSPRLAYDTAATLGEARRLWGFQRENLMLKVPATPEGIPAIEQLTGEGINVNITLLFSRAGCRQGFEAYMSGLESRSRRGGPIRRMASVPSMFVSPIDAMVDPKLEARAATASGDAQVVLRSLVGKVAIANAKLAYQDLPQCTLAASRRARRSRTAPHVGEHRDQGSAPPGSSLRGIPHRARYHRHHSASDARRASRSRRGREPARARHRRGARGRGRSGADGHLPRHHRPGASRRRGQGILVLVRQTHGVHREQAASRDGQARPGAIDGRRMMAGP
jgi:transaldolase